MEAIEIGSETGDPLTNGSSVGDGCTNESESLSLDAVFDVLSNRRRRAAIAYLNEHGDDSVRLRDLAEQIAAWENGVSVEEVSYEERKRVYTSLYQSHLKKMHSLGIVRYDRNRGMVERTPTTGQFESYLRTIVDDDGFRNGASLGGAILSVAVVAGAWAGLLPVLSGNGFVVAALVAAIFLVASAVEAVGDRSRVR